MNNPFAFPKLYDADANSDKRNSQQGMTLRDYLAGQVIGALFITAKDLPNITREDCVTESYEIADEMLKVRQK